MPSLVQVAKFRSFWTDPVSVMTPTFAAPPSWNSQFWAIMGTASSVRSISTITQDRVSWVKLRSSGVAFGVSALWQGTPTGGTPGSVITATMNGTSSASIMIMEYDYPVLAAFVTTLNGFQAKHVNQPPAITAIAGKTYVGFRGVVILGNQGPLVSVGLDQGYIETDALLSSPEAYPSVYWADNLSIDGTGQLIEPLWTFEPPDQWLSGFNILHEADTTPIVISPSISSSTQGTGVAVVVEEAKIPPRQVLDFSLTTVERGKISVRIMDRITVDDVFLHLVNQETYRILAKKDVDPTVNPLFKDALLKEKFTAGQN